MGGLTVLIVKLGFSSRTKSHAALSAKVLLAVKPLAAVAFQKSQEWHTSVTLCWVDESLLFCYRVPVLLGIGVFGPVRKLGSVENGSEG
jgi:hypothetical protein